MARLRKLRDLIPYGDLIELLDIAYFLNIQFILIIIISLRKTKSRQKKRLRLKLNNT